MSQAQLDPMAIYEGVRRDLAALIDDGRMADARTLAAAAREAFPDDPALAGAQAYVHLRMGSPQLATASANEALALGSQDPDVMMVIGMAARMEQRHAEAAEALLAAHRGQPGKQNISRILVEEAFAAHGVEGARPIFAEVHGRTHDPVVAHFWAERLFAAGLHDEMPPSFVSAPVMSPRAWMEARGEAPDFVGETEILTMQDPPVYGAPPADRPQTKVSGYTPYAGVVRGATIFSKSSVVLTDDGVALNDTLADAQYGRFLDIHFDAAITARDDHRLLLDLCHAETRQLDAAVMLSGWAAEHFGHWFPEYLCRLAYLERHPRFAELPIIVDAGMPPQHVEFLRLLVTNPIVELPARSALHVGELLVASPAQFYPVHLKLGHEVPPEKQGGLPLGGCRYLQDRIAERLPPEGPRGRKLYLSRKNTQWRKLLNEDAVSAALAARGFEVLYPEEMSLEAQVRMYQGASLVVAPNGSSLLNAIFAAPDVKLLVLSQRGLFTWGSFYGLMSELGYELSFFCGGAETDEKHSHYEIPVAELMAAVDELSA
jgi:hypothetical protein